MGSMKCRWKFLLSVPRYLGAEGSFGRTVARDTGPYVRGNTLGKVAHVHHGLAGGNGR